MRMFAKQQTRGTTLRGVSRAALSGAAWHELLTETVKAMLVESGADRAAVWLDSRGESDQGTFRFRGVVGDRTGEALPGEWNSLAPELSLLRSLLSGQTVEQDLNGPSEPMTLGALIGMQKAIWVPVRTQGTLRGVIFAGAQKKKTILPKTALEAQALELAMALELLDERRLSQERQRDVAMLRLMLADLNNNQSPELALQRLAESCTRNQFDEPGPECLFCAIGEIASADSNEAVRADTAIDDAPAQRGNTNVNFSWRSGDEAWAQVLEAEPNASVWRQALQRGCVTGQEPAATALEELGRVVAIPLQAEGRTLGVFVAGLPQHGASLATLDRLELRAAIAAQALLHRKRSCQAARQHAWNSALLAASNEAIALLDSRGGIADLSGKAQELLAAIGGRSGIPVERESRRRFLQSFRPSQRERIEGWLKRAGEGDSPLQEPLEADLATGASVRLRTLRSPANGYTVVWLDPLPTETKAQPTRAEAELSNVIEWLDEGVVLFDARQGIRAINTRFAQMAGLTPEESVAARTLNGLISRIASRTTDPDNFAARWRALAHGADSGMRDEVQFARPVPRVLERVARPLLDATGARMGRVELYRDLTAQRIFHSKLIRTEKLAALGQLVTSIAHELSNPLTSILGRAQRLLEQDSGSEQASEAKQILQEAERASSILKQLLLTARDTRPERHKIALNDVVKRTVELQRFSLAAEKVRAELELDPTLPRVLGDAGQLQQVLMNLIGNARQAIEQGGKGGRILLRTKRNKDGSAVLEVADDGPGIPEPILPRIFDPFFTTKPAGIGTGLGLSIVLGIVREHGGQVRVTSPSAGGATFAIELPPADAYSRTPEMGIEAAPEPIEELPDASENALSPWSGSLVLVVEDEATVAQLIADVLEDAGLGVDVLLDARQALHAAGSVNYDLVICDMKMPDMDGEQFFKSLSRTNSALARRTLFVTGDVLAARTRDFIERQHLPHLAKPFRVEELTEKVRQVLAENSLREPRTAKSTKTKVARN